MKEYSEGEEFYFRVSFERLAPAPNDAPSARFALGWYSVGDMGKAKRLHLAEEKRKKRDLWTRTFTWIGLACGFASWGYATAFPDPNVYFGSLLLFFGFVCLLIAFWDRFEFRKTIKVISCAFITISFALGEGFWISHATRSSFVFVVPGVWVNGDSWDFVVSHRGPKTNYNVDVLFQDEDRLSSLKRAKSELSRADLLSFSRRLHFDEVGPMGRGRLFALQFIWVPGSPDFEHYTVEFSTREGHEHEELQIARVNGRWFYETLVKDSENGRILLDCMDIGFPGEHRGKKECFPDIIQTGN